MAGEVVYLSFGFLSKFGASRQESAPKSPTAASGKTLAAISHPKTCIPTTNATTMKDLLDRHLSEYEWWKLL